MQAVRDRSGVSTVEGRDRERGGGRGERDEGFDEKRRIGLIERTRGR